MEPLFEGSLNGSKWVFRTIFRTFFRFLRIIFGYIYGTFLGSWTCKEAFLGTLFPRGFYKYRTKRVPSCTFFFLRVYDIPNILDIWSHLQMKFHGDSSHSPTIWVEPAPKIIYTLKTPGSAWPGKGVHRGHTPFRLNDMTRKSVNSTLNVTQSWVNLTPLFVKSAKSWPNSGSLLTRNWVWPQMDPFPGHSNPGVLV